MAVSSTEIESEFDKDIAEESKEAQTFAKPTYGTCVIVVGNAQVTRKHVTRAVCDKVASHFHVKGKWTPE